MQTIASKPSALVAPTPQANQPNLTPQPLANPIVNIQNAPAAPEFGGAVPSVGTRPTMYGLETDALLILLHLHHWLPAYCKPYDNTDEYFSQINLASIGDATEQVRRIVWAFLMKASAGGKSFVKNDLFDPDKMGKWAGGRHKGIGEATKMPQAISAEFVRDNRTFYINKDWQ